MITAIPVRLARSQIQKAGEVLARAFHDDPYCTYITPGDAKRARTLPWAMATFVRYGHLFGEVYTIAGPTMEGVAVWASPDHTRVGFGQMLRTGLLVAPFKIGLRDTLRFLNMVDHLEKFHEKEVPRRHWYLPWLGVDPPSRGQGIGSALLQPILSRADEEGVPCYLQNTNARNLAFYRKHGFEVVSEVDLPKGGPRVWTMRREPRRKA